MRFMLILVTAFFTDLLIRILFDPGRWSPDLLLLSVLYISLNRPLGEAYLYAFLAGVLWDGAFYEIQGTHALLFVLTTMIIARLRLLIWAQFSLSRLLLGILACIFVRFGEVIFWLSYLEYDIPVTLAYRYVLSGAVITGICFMLYPLFFSPFQSMMQRNSQPMVLLGR